MDAELRQYLEAMEGRLNKRLSKLEDGLSRLKNRSAKIEERAGPHHIVFPRFEAQMRETKAAFAEASEDKTIRFRLLKEDQAGPGTTRN